MSGGAYEGGAGDVPSTEEIEARLSERPDLFERLNGGDTRVLLALLEAGTEADVESADVRLLRALDGSWLALTPPDATVRYGAQGRTREEACTAFTAAGARIWSALSSSAQLRGGGEQPVDQGV